LGTNSAIYGIKLEYISWLRHSSRIVDFMNIVSIEGTYYGSSGLFDGEAYKRFFKITDIENLLRDVVCVILQNSDSDIELRQYIHNRCIDRYELKGNLEDLQVILSISYNKKYIDVPAIVGIKTGDIIYAERPIKILAY
jgi:hypothetical protein